MIPNNGEKRVTSVTLLEKMRRRRLEPISKVQSTEATTPLLPDKLVISTVVKEWLDVCLHERHIEPSQPEVGRIIGWPQRSFFKESLLVDLQCFCIKKGISKSHIPSEISFYAVLDHIFELLGHDRYVFPPPEICRTRYLKLLELENATTKC